MGGVCVYVSKKNTEMETLSPDNVFYDSHFHHGQAILFKVGFFFVSKIPGAEGDKTYRLWFCF